MNLKHWIAVMGLAAAGTAIAGGAPKSRDILFLFDGSIDVLPKPYRVEDLARRIRALLDNDEEKRRVQM